MPHTAAGATYDSHLFVPMSFFCNIKNSLALSFVEPVVLRVVMSDGGYAVTHITTGSGSSATTAIDRGTMAVSNPELYCEYRVLDPESEDATIEENYDSVLTQLSYDYHTEVEASGTLAADKDLEMSVELKDPGVISAAYVIVSCDYQDVHTTVGSSPSVAAANMIAAEQPLELAEIGFKASGQDIVPTMPAKIFELYGRRNLSQYHHAVGYGNTYQSRDDPINLHNVYKIPFDLDSDNRYNSGGISLRELNAPTITVKVRMANGSGTDGEGGANEGQAPGGATENNSTALGGNKNPAALAGKKVKMRVVLKKHTLISTDPQNGRLVQSISN
jgi:hypothetical protein